ncbi:hypothetical protein Salat_2465600 [Sesamum alatum]|uniref:GRPD C-terminal domain-containing protein n=1 Tax=Sesamum alatum TaxID=300844 RepID=A0AAE1XRT4_9LAMI|nr:hypothetical protein Salat_2465600 [Sesamum alatum]
MLLRIFFKQKRSQKAKGPKKELEEAVVVGSWNPGETCTLAESADIQNGPVVNSPWSLKLSKYKTMMIGHILELTGPQTVRLFLGGRLDYESRRCEKHKSEHQLENYLVTAVDSLPKDPYGRGSGIT